MSDVKVITGGDGLERHKLPMVCTCGTGEERARKLAQADTRPSWDLTTTMAAVALDHGTVRVDLDQWWGVECEVVQFCGKGLEATERRTRVYVECDDPRLGLAAIYEYGIRLHEEWSGEKFDPAFGETRA